jgi:hypothetical protein
LFNQGLGRFVARELVKWRQCDHLLRWWERPLDRP